MLQLERRALSLAASGLKVERRADSEVDTITGYAAVFYDEKQRDATQFRLWGNTYERILPGAFDDALKEDDVRCLFNHRDEFILGRSSSETLKLSIDAVGLRYECVLPNTSAGRDLRESMARKDIRESSFGFTLRGGVDDEAWAEETVKIEGGGEAKVIVRQLKRVKLYDVSPVTFPAYTGTSSEIAQRSLQAWQQAQEPTRLIRAQRRLRLLG